jgi:stage III sporulation protein SpoIIIAA
MTAFAQPTQAYQNAMTQGFVIPDLSNVEIDGAKELMDILPGMVWQIISPQINSLEEIVLDYGRPLTIWNNDGQEIIYDGIQNKPAFTTTKEHISTLRSKLANRFKANFRTGIDGTMHRVSAIKDTAGEQIIGITVRIARWIPNVAEPIRQYLERDQSVLLIGGPGVGKTTVMRGCVAIMGEKNGTRTLLVEINDEIAGAGDIACSYLSRVRKLPCPDPKDMAKILIHALVNKTPRDIVVDEIGNNDDAETLLTISRRKVRIMATAHGESLLEIFENPVLHPLLGGLNMQKRERNFSPAFKIAIEIPARGKFIVHEDFMKAIDAILAKKPYKGLKVGNW